MLGTMIKYESCEWTAVINPCPRFGGVYALFVDTTMKSIFVNRNQWCKI